MNTINERFFILVRHLGITQNEFAISVNSGSGRISNIIKGRNKPDYILLRRVLTTYKSVSPDWLLLGEGDLERTSGELEGKALLEELTAIEQKIKDVKRRV